MQEGIFPFAKGDFFVGCNYWASHAGTAMWSDWQTEIIEADLCKLAQCGLQVLRVFPLWPDFQPIDLLYRGGGQPVEYRFGEELLPDNEAGRAGVSAIAMKRFDEFTQIAQKYKLKLIVGLVTGYMSGRLFVPPALRGRDILTDKVSILWQVRFVKNFVKTFKNCDAIIAWDLGNECNVMQNVTCREDAWVWTSSISNAIKAIDISRPVVSGMHSLSPTGNWTIQDQGELTDILTTHPYPIWTPHCDNDPLNTIGPILHACAESRFYEDLGGKPCFAEEMGTMGPMIANNAVSGDFARASFYSLWAHNCHGVLWWCANEQTNLNQAPYDWNACEGELGLLDKHGEPKQVLKEMGRMRKIIETLPFERLPERITEGVCLVNSLQDHWAVAFSSFILSKQAGFDIEFQYEDQPIKESLLYLVPSIKGWFGVRKHRWKELLKRVSQGATVYISIEDSFILEFEELTGLSIRTRSRRSGAENVSFEGIQDDLSLQFESTMKFELETVGAEIIGKEADGNIVFASSSYGKGKVYFLSFPMEMNLIQRSGVFNDADTQPYWKIYEYISADVRKSRVVSKGNPQIGVTEHSFYSSKRVAVLINYSPFKQEVPIEIRDGWKVNKVLFGDMQNADIEKCLCKFNANDMIILELTNNKEV